MRRPGTMVSCRWDEFVKERSLRDLFHLIKQVLPEEQQVVSVPPESTVRDALDIMRRHGFNQLPVVEGKEVLGVFSYRSLAQGLLRLPERVREPLTLTVDDFLEDLRFAGISDELSILFDEFDIKDAVLIGSQDRLLGVVTTIDVLRYFYTVASPYVLLREIELAIRELIRTSASPDELKECIEQSLRKHYDELKQPVPACLEEMNFNDYLQLLRFRGTWPRFAPAFGRNCDLVLAKVAPLPSLRNDVFHFRRELTAEEYETLRECRDWLLTRIRRFEASRRGSANE
jgi:CBS domain-containing protein